MARKALPPVDPLNPRCFFDVTIGGEPAGRLIFELFTDRAPCASENFRCLCTGERGVCADTGRELHYAGSALWRVVPGEALYGGALAGGRNPDDAAVAPPDGHDSAYGVFFEPDADSLPHDRAGLLSAQPLVAGPACAASQFALTLGQAGALDAVQPDGRRACVFGRLIRGYGLLRQLEALPSRGGAPTQQVLVARCGELRPGDDGVVEGPDGDPFPAWPQDHPWACDVADGEAVYAARCAAAETLRASGNEAYKAGDLRAADAKYAKALRYLERSYSREAETLHEETAARRAQIALSVPLLLNAAAVKLRLRDGRGAVEACDAVWRLENEAPGGAPGTLSVAAAASPGGGVWNAKALYRRGAGLALCREFEAAERDLARAAAMAPQDDAVAAELRRVREAAKARKQRERAAFAAAFGAPREEDGRSLS